MERITVDEVSSLLQAGEDITIVDSRSEKAWASSDEKAAGALRIPPDQAEEYSGDLNKDHPIVVYCT